MWESPTKGSIIKHKQPEAPQKRPPQQTSLLCLNKWKSITFILILPFCSHLPVIKEYNLTALYGGLYRFTNGKQRALRECWASDIDIPSYTHCTSNIISPPVSHILSVVLCRGRRARAQVLEGHTHSCRFNLKSPTSGQQKKDKKRRI